MPPGIWFGFQGISEGTALLLNIANIEHSPEEIERKELNAQADALGLDGKSYANKGEVAQAILDKQADPATEDTDTGEPTADADGGEDTDPDNGDTDQDDQVTE